MASANTGFYGKIRLRNQEGWKKTLEHKDEIHKLFAVSKQSWQHFRCQENKNGIDIDGTERSTWNRFSQTQKRFEQQPSLSLINGSPTWIRKQTCGGTGGTRPSEVLVLRAWFISLFSRYQIVFDTSLWCRIVIYYQRSGGIIFFGVLFLSICWYL